MVTKVTTFREQEMKVLHRPGYLIAFLGRSELQKILLVHLSTEAWNVNVHVCVHVSTHLQVLVLYILSDTDHSINSHVE